MTIAEFQTRYRHDAAFHHHVDRLAQTAAAAPCASRAGQSADAQKVAAAREAIRRCLTAGLALDCLHATWHYESDRRRCNACRRWLPKITEKRVG